MIIEKITQTVVYENPAPNLFSRHGFFPGVVKLNSGKLLCLFVMGQAFESADQTTFISTSDDDGNSWKLKGRLYDKNILDIPTSDCLKPTLLKNGQLIAIGYRFDRSNPDNKLVNEKTGGLRDSQVIVAFSGDDGQTWSTPLPIPLKHPSLEISGPCIELNDGTLLAGGSPFPLWNGENPHGCNGVLLKSADRGKTWNDDITYFQSINKTVLPLETRFCQMADGRIVAMVWAHDTASGKNLPNQITVSHDNGKNWSIPIDTRIPAQASSLIPFGDNMLLTIHAHRETNVGLYVRVMSLIDDVPEIVAEKNIWDKTAAAKIQSYCDMSTNLKFGQPSLIRLGDSEFLAIHWAIIEGQGKIFSHRLKIANI